MSVKDALRFGAEKAAWLASTATVWTWTSTVCAAPGTSAARVRYLGRRSAAPVAARAFGDPAVDIATLPPRRRGRDILVTEGPRPGAIRVPEMLRLLIDVRDPMAVVVARASRGVWRGIQPLADRARVVPITDPADADRVSAELLEPYAAGRQHEHVVQVPRAAARALAMRGGLVTVHLDGEEVAAVFTDATRYRLLNTLNTYLGIRDARDAGCQVFDFGLADAHPIENGLLQFKRMRGAAISTLNCRSAFSVSVPRGVAAEYLWARPLVALEGAGLALHVGVPDQVTDSVLVDRLRQKLLCPGVTALQLHAARPIDPGLASVIRALRRHTHAPEGQGPDLDIRVVEAPASP